jgi:hypothetical protein
MSQTRAINPSELNPAGKQELLLEVIGTMNVNELERLLHGLPWRVWPVAALGDFLLGIERSNTDLESEAWARAMVVKLETAGLHVLVTLWNKGTDR